MTRQTMPPLITCRQCRTQHRATVCPICKTATPHFAVLKGNQKERHHEN